MESNNGSGNGKPVVSLDPRRLLTVEELSGFLQVAPKTIYNQIMRKSERKFPIRVKRVGRMIRFDTEEVKKYLNSP